MSVALQGQGDSWFGRGGFRRRPRPSGPPLCGLSTCAASPLGASSLPPGLAKAPHGSPSFRRRHCDFPQVPAVQAKVTLTHGATPRAPGLPAWSSRRQAPPSPAVVALARLVPKCWDNFARCQVQTLRGISDAFHFHPWEQLTRRPCSHRGWDSLSAPWIPGVTTPQLAGRRRAGSRQGRGHAQALRPGSNPRGDLRLHAAGAAACEGGAGQGGQGGGQGGAVS